MTDQHAAEPALGPDSAPPPLPTDPPGEPVLVGIDFTADTLRLLLADEAGAPLVHETWPLPPLETEEAWEWEVGGRIATLFARDGQRRSAIAIAIAAPGSVDPLTGRLQRSAGQPEWEDLPVVEILRRHFGTPAGAENRTYAALLGEAWQGAAAGEDHAMFISLRGLPSAAVIAGGRLIRGARYEAGALPAAPELDPSRPLRGTQLEQTAGLLADAIALLDPDIVVLDAAEDHQKALLPLLQRVLDEVAPGPRVVAAALGERAAVVGALRMATTLAYEGEHKP